MAEHPKRIFALRFSLRTLLVVMLLLGPAIGVGWPKWQAYQEWRARRAAELELQREREAAQLAFTKIAGGLSQLQIRSEITKEKLAPKEESFEVDLPLSTPTPCGNNQ